MSRSPGRGTVQDSVFEGVANGVRGSRLVLLLTFLPALGLRLGLASLTAWPLDVATWLGVGWDVVAGQGLYGRLGFSYPPGWGLVLAPLVTLATALLPPGEWAYPLTFPPDMVPIAHPLVLVLLKMPAILADMAVGAMLWRQSKVAAALWLYNPLAIFVSSVHGQYDSLPGLLAAGGVLAALSGRMFVSGLLVGFGASLKVAPAYALPLLAAFALSKQGLADSRQGRTGGLARLTAGALLSTMPGLLVLGSGFFVSVEARVEPDVIRVGGLNFAALTNLPLPWTIPIAFWTETYPWLVRVASLVVVAGGSALVLKMGKANLVLAAAASQVVAALSQGITQPQYALWYVPMVFMSGSWAATVLGILVTLTSVAFYDALVGHVLAYTCQPASLYFNLCYPIQDIWLGYWDYLSQKGPLGGPIKDDMTGMVGVLGAALATLLLLYLLGRAVAARGTREGHGSSQGSIPLVMAVTVAVTVAMLLGIVAVQVPVMGRLAQVGAGHGHGSFRVQVHSYGISYSLPDLGFPYRWALTAACRPDYLDTIYILDDPQLPADMAPRASVWGLKAHIVQNSKVLDWSPRVQLLDVQSVLQLVRSGKKSVLIDPWGYVPVDIPLEEMKAWIHGGGVFIWLGDKLGYWGWGGKRVRLKPPLDVYLWGRTIYDPEGAQAPPAIPLGPAENLGMQFRGITWGPSPAAVEGLGGRILGWTSSDGRRVSTAVIPLGAGSVVVFGDRLARWWRSEAEVGEDIVNILFRGLTDPAFIARGGRASGPQYDLLAVRRDCPGETVVLGSSDRWVYRFVRVFNGK